MFHKLSKFFLYASIFSVVVVLPSTFFPFIGGKYYFFRICVELALAFFFLHWAFEDRLNSVKEKLKTIYRHPLFIAVSAFVLFYLLASLFAYDAPSAFWSNFERGEGGFQMVHYYLFFLLLLLAFKEKKDWANLFKFSVISAILVVLYGVFAQLGCSFFRLDASCWVNRFISPYAGGASPFGAWAKLTDARFQGSLGNPAYVAPYLMFALFYVAYLFFNSKGKFLKYGLISSSIFFLFFFYLSKTRGGLIGLGVAVLLALIWLFFKTSDRTKKIITYILLAVVVGGLFVSWVSFSLVPKCAKEGCATFEKTLIQNRLLNFNFGEQTFKTRFWTWGSAWDGFKERPILGWGQENFSTVFDRHFNTNHYVPGTNSETWFDRAHSVVFDYLAETGLLGFLSYLGMFFVLFWQIFKKRINPLNLSLESPTNPDIPKPASNVLAFSSALVIAIPVGYFIQGLALFDVLPIYINLFLFLSFATFLFIENERIK